MLSAQCTDKMVNIVTARLFNKYKTVEDYAKADIRELEQDVKSTGFYRNKAKNIKAAARLILERYHGEVPKKMEELLTLPGVARKTANIVLGNAYNNDVSQQAWLRVQGIAVDTHVGRLSQRLGFSKNVNTDKIEKDLMKIIPKKDWFRLTYLLIEHGRATCRAPLPKCDQCFLNKLCPSAFNFPNFKNRRTS